MCHYCRFAHPTRQGGLKLYTILVSGLDPDVIEEDVHAAFEDRLRYVYDVQIPKDEDGCNVLNSSDGTTHAIVRFYSMGRFVAPSPMDVDGIYEGVDGALGIETLNVQISENHHTVGHIHRIKWGKITYQSVTPCLIRDLPNCSLKEHDLLHSDNRHMDTERKQKEEEETRRKINDKRNHKKLNFYTETLNDLKHPKIMSSAFNPDAQAGLASQACKLLASIFTFVPNSI